MVDIDILLRGIPGRTNEGYLGQSSAVLVDKDTLVDVGSLARRHVLKHSLEEANVNPDQIQHVLLTHLHFDHIENLDLFTNADVYVYEPELKRVEAGNLDWATPRWAPEILAEHNIVTFTLGDVTGVVEAIPTPGHSEHHISFLLTDDRTYGFTGDAVKNVREFKTMEPTVIHDRDAAIESLQRIRERVDLAIPGHDAPFFINADGNPVPTGDVELGVDLHVASDASASVTISSTRTEIRPLPPNVRDVAARQPYR